MENRSQILYFVTGNNSKFKEISVLFKKKELKYELKQSSVKPIEIQANNLKEVVLYKLKSVIEKINDSFFVEDSGFFVDIPLNGFPGVYSSYIYKTIGNKGIINLIDDFDKSRAHFTTTIALFFKPLEEVFLFEGEVKGKVAKTIRGNQGFGFDPVFIPDLLKNKTFGEISIDEKNKLSHRAQALEKMINFLKNN